VTSAGRPTSLPEDGEGTGVVLGRRTGAGTPLRLATLSWRLHADDPWGQTAERFLGSVAGASQAGEPCDLLVAAGLTVNEVPPAEAVVGASGGLPVLFEGKRADAHSWLLAHAEGGRARVSLLRRRQVVTSFNQYDRFPRLAEIIASGAGGIAFAATDLKLVLFICGETNVLDYTRRGSVLKAPPPGDEGADLLAEVLSGPWVVLNSAHEPYYPQIRSTGFAKVGVVRSKHSSAGPTLRWLVEAGAQFRDGTETPVAVVHVNNFSGDMPQTVAYAEAAFGDTEGRVRRVHGPVSGPDSSWGSSVFEIQLGRQPA
jgi:hypothetical protein